jgi:hypothetical protein
LTLVIGCPVFERAWVLEDWFDAVEALNPPDDTRFLFGLTRSRDATEEIIARRAPAAEVLDMGDLGFGEGDKADPDRYAYLAGIRNEMLKQVRRLNADAYLSLDSDILLRPDALSALLSQPEDRYALGALVDMGGRELPGYWSWMTLFGGDAMRPREARQVETPLRGEPARKVGVIMGAKLLRREAYRQGVYADHVLGEDVAFALSLEAAEVDCWLVPGALGEHRYRLN